MAELTAPPVSFYVTRRRFNPIAIPADLRMAMAQESNITVLDTPAALAEARTAAADYKQRMTTPPPAWDYTPDVRPKAIPNREIADTPGHPDRLKEIRKVFALGHTVESEGVVDEIVRGAAALRYSDRWMSEALATLVKQGGPHALPAARALLEPPLLDSSNLLSASKAGAAIVPDLERVLSSSNKRFHGSALQALATLKRDVTREAIGALDDRETFHGAAAALGLSREGTGDEDAVAALSMAALNAPYKGPIVEAWRESEAVSRSARWPDCGGRAANTRGCTPCGA